MTSSTPLPRKSGGKLRRIAGNTFLYAILTLVAIITAFPFVWVLATSLKGPTDAIYSVPPQLIPHQPTLDNYRRVWDQLPIASFFLNSIVVSVITVAVNLLFTSLAAYPFAKMNFRGRDAIFFLLLATFVVPPQLTQIPSFVMAVNVFRYYDTLFAVIFPSLATVFNIFLLRQAFKAVPNDLIDAARIDSTGELRIWWSILMPVVRPSLATTAIITFGNQWNDFFWPSLMLHTRSKMTLQVGLVALQGMFTSDMRGIAAGVVMTVIPIIIFFLALQRQFERGISGTM
ncbi:MAG TPA: carbohydrate ABC transporter permease [Thermoflexales bacterium]|nr:carbohydrate ABC transporter permease [Thermoflexales bacterium]HRA00787.1 carbohydrate ABC transporter permease [Thermoflexales bacterium]